MTEENHRKKFGGSGQYQTKSENLHVSENMKLVINIQMQPWTKSHRKRLKASS